MPPLYVIGKELVFPPVDQIQPDGLLAIGGDLSLERLLLAYQNGIFPWYEGDVVMWFCPDPRFVLFPHDYKLNHGLKQQVNKSNFHFTTNKAFDTVIHQCRITKRKNQQGTWITKDLAHAFIGLHHAGYAHSAEIWDDDELIGGLYGLRLGKVFFGESMFSKRNYASRLAFYHYLRLLTSEGVEMIDCQVYSEYLETMGARLISGDDFNQRLKKLIQKP